jgi:hypothetical protein
MCFLSLLMTWPMTKRKHLIGSGLNRAPCDKCTWKITNRKCPSSNVGNREVNNSSQTEECYRDVKEEEIRSIYMEKANVFHAGDEFQIQTRKALCSDLPVGYFCPTGRRRGRFRAMVQRI